MTNSPSPSPGKAQGAKARPFRRAVLRGLGVVMPPLLTLVLFIWAWATIDSYVLKPIETGLGHVVVFWSMRTNMHSKIPQDVDSAGLLVVDRNDDPVPPLEVMACGGQCAADSQYRAALLLASRVV